MTSTLERFTPDHPCPVCGGFGGAPRGQGVRCVGMAGERIVWCTREEHAGGLARDEDCQPPAYPHRRQGECGCGVQHDAAPTPIAAAPRRARRAEEPPGRVDQVYTYYTETGEVPAFRVLRYLPKDFRPEHLNARGAWVRGLNGVVKVPYRLPELRRADPDEYVYVVEGEKCVERLRREGLTATTTQGGAGQRGQWREHSVRDWFRDRHVVILPDNNNEGLLYTQAACEGLEGVARTIRVIRLPGLADAKEDVVEWLNLRGGSVSALRQLADRTPPWEPGSAIGGGDDERPEVDGGEPDPKKVRPAAWRALQTSNAPRPHLFRQSGILVRIAHAEDETPIVQELNADRLMNELGDAALWYELKPHGKEGRPKKTYIWPPLRVVKAVLGDKDAPLPVLERLVETPVFGPGGELQLDPGYHAASRTYYEPRHGFNLPAVPTEPDAAEMARARHMLLVELLGDFPFVSPSDRAHALAAVLLPFVRDFIQGSTPGHIVEAPTQGSGKGLLTDVIVIPSVAGKVARMTAETDESEWKKSLLSLFLLAPSVILIDNVSKPLTSDTLAAAMTLEVYVGRKLGGNESVRVPVRNLWLATANNPVMNRDMVRRFVRIRIDPQTDHPELRDLQVFRHPNLRLWARQWRAELAWSCLVLVRAWLAAGQPRPSTPTMGSFEEWAAVIGGILQVAEVPGFLGNALEFMTSADREGNVWRSFVSAWWARFADQPVVSAQLFELAEATEGLEIRGNSDRARATSFGSLIAGQRDRVYTVPEDADDEAGKQLELKITAPRRKVHGAQVWRLEAPGGLGLFRDSNATAEGASSEANTSALYRYGEVPQVTQVPPGGGGEPREPREPLPVHEITGHAGDEEIEL